MAATMHSTDPSGSIVAFEGHPETISTQLRLLPTSPDILVLPGIQCYLAEDGTNDNFEADAYIRKAHEAVVARNEAARAFLQISSGVGRKLVFLSGGTPSAQAMCIREIMKHDTDSDDEKAEAKFNFLIKEGLAELGAQAKKWDENERFKLAALSGDGSEFDIRRDTKMGVLAPQRLHLEQIDEDPITKAMRAAEALDRQTGYLQPSTELDLTLSSRPRSTSLPMYGYSDSYDDAAPFYVFGGSTRQRADSNASGDDATEQGITPRASIALKFAVTHYDDTPDQFPLSPSLDLPYSPSCAGETYGPTFLHSPLPALSTSKSDGFDLRSPADVVFGEASLVDVRVPGEKGPVLRVRSLDRIYPSTSKYQDFDLDPASRRGLDEDEHADFRPRSWDARNDKDSNVTRVKPIDRPRTIMVKSRSFANVNLAPAPAGRKRKPFQANYVDRGTDADSIEDVTEKFTPVFPVTEDLVVYFKEEVSDVILDKTIRGFKDGTYPILCQSLDSSETDTVNEHLPRTPKTASTCDGDITPRARVSEEATVIPSTLGADDYDPFAYNHDHPAWSPKKATSVKTVESPRARKIEAPPTPEKTPSPSESGKDHKVHEFGICSEQTAVTIQNSLRNILNIYFPPDLNSYSQFQFSFLPELEGLWKPIFREAEPGSPRTNNHRMDQILAVGSQQGVDREYSSKIVGLLSKLGFKDSGMNRSGRLDFRYLLANAMQAFTAQPLTNQASDNPFSNPYLLATLIIPHLETYLALNSEVRYLLLEYPPQHLPTVLALQKLVGVELMKVAQIVDAKSGDLGAFKHIRGASISRIVEKTDHLGKPSCSDVSVSKANFLLTSSATESEISTFISTVRKILTGVSQYYAPEEPSVSAAPAAPTREPSTRKTKPPPLTSRFSAFPKPNGLQSPTTPGFAGGPLSPAPSRPPSVAETVKTFKSARTARSRKSRRRPPTADGGESIMTYDPAEDSDYDFEERRLMPIFMQKSSRRPKPNSRKALKFLGLA